MCDQRRNKLFLPIGKLNHLTKHNHEHIIFDVGMAEVVRNHHPPQIRTHRRGKEWYYDAGESMGIDGGQRFSVPIMWIGLRPSVVDQIKSNLPPDQLQPLTENDHKKIDILLRMDADGFVTDEVKCEVRYMRDIGVKVQLDALHWIGQDYMTNWIVSMLQNCGKCFQ